MTKGNPVIDHRFGFSCGVHRQFYLHADMKKQIFLMGFCMVWAVGMHGLCGAEAAEPTKVLMVGNSLTYTYDIPKMLVGLAGSKDKSLNVDTQVAGGKSLKWHLEEGVRGQPVAEKIAKGGYDLVVLQDNSRAMQKAEGALDLAAAAVEFDKIIKSAGTKMMFYTGFVRDPNPSEASVSRFMDAYTEQAKKYQASCAPVALAFQRFAELGKNVALLDNETGKSYALNKVGTHQSPFGSYLAACVIYSAMYDQSPEGSSYRNLPDGTELSAEDAALAQQIAWKTWMEYNDSAAVKGS